MNQKEVTEIFSVMMLAWPNAEMFKGGIQKLGPTIKLWARCLGDVDFWLGQKAVIQLCRECKFPPSIAEFKGQADAVRQEIMDRINSEFARVRSAEFMYGSLDKFYNSLSIGSDLKTVIDMMGGVNALTVTHTTVSMWNLTGFENAYMQLVRNENVLSGNKKHALIGAGKETT